jgi:hypothetical protein
MQMQSGCVCVCLSICVCVCFIGEEGLFKVGNGLSRSLGQDLRVNCSMLSTVRRLGTEDRIRVTPDFLPQLPAWWVESFVVVSEQHCIQQAPAER